MARSIPRDYSPGTLPTRLYQRLSQLSPVRAAPYGDQLAIGTGRRALALSLSVLIPALLQFLLLYLGAEKPPMFKDARVTVVSLEATEISEEAPKPDNQPRERSDEPSTSPRPQPLPPAPIQPLPAPAAEPQSAPKLPTPSEQPPTPQIPPSARPPAGPVYGPPNIGGASSSSDTKRVGTAPNGEPLYAAAWYREPSDGELRGYLSTANGPGWGLIACRTVADFRVEDCVALDEYPSGSQINRAVLAAAWQFRVRPPRLGGRSQVGAWVRIRIDYATGRR